MKKLFLLLAIIASNYAVAYELGVGDLVPKCKVPAGIGTGPEAREHDLSIGNELKKENVYRLSVLFLDLIMHRQHIVY